MFRDILHKLKIFFCDDDVEKIYVRDSTVIRNNEIHRMYNEILYELGDIFYANHNPDLAFLRYKR